MSALVRYPDKLKLCQTTQQKVPSINIIKQH
jgi:hypothetical protein